MGKKSKGKRVKAKEKKQKEEQKNYLLIAMVSLFVVFFLSLMVQSIFRTSTSNDSGYEYGRYEPGYHPRLSQYYEHNPQELTLDKQMMGRLNWAEVTCWASNDHRKYSEDPADYADLQQIYSSDSPGYIAQHTGLECLASYAVHRDVYFQEWLTATSGQINLDMSDQQMQAYYHDFPEERAWDEEMLQRQYYNGYCWVSDEAHFYQEVPGEWYQDLDKRFGVECLRAYANRRNALFLQWQTQQHQI